MEAMEREGEEDQERYENIMAAIEKATDAATTVKERSQRRSDSSGERGRPIPESNCRVLEGARRRAFVTLSLSPSWLPLAERVRKERGEKMCCKLQTAL